MNYIIIPTESNYDWIMWNYHAYRSTEVNTDKFICFGLSNSKCLVNGKLMNEWIIGGIQEYPG